MHDNKLSHSLHCIVSSFIAVEHFVRHDESKESCTFDHSPKQQKVICISCQSLDIKKLTFSTSITRHPRCLEKFAIVILTHLCYPVETYQTFKFFSYTLLNIAIFFVYLFYNWELTFIKTTAYSCTLSDLALQNKVAIWFYSSCFMIMF